MVRERVQPVKDPRDERLRFGDGRADCCNLRFHRDLVARRLQRFDPPIEIPHLGIQASREIRELLDHAPQTTLNALETIGMPRFPKHAATLGAFETVLLSLLLPPSGNTFDFVGAPNVPVLQLLNARNSTRRLLGERSPERSAFRMGCPKNRPRNGKDGSEEKMEERPSHCRLSVLDGEKPKQDPCQEPRCQAAGLDVEVSRPLQGRKLSHAPGVGTAFTGAPARKAWMFSIVVSTIR